MERSELPVRRNAQSLKWGYSVQGAAIQRSTTDSIRSRTVRNILSDMFRRLAAIGLSSGWKPPSPIECFP